MPMSAADAGARTAAIHKLIATLTVLVHRDRSARHLLRESLQLLERKIVERSGKTGEHYVAHSLREYRQISSLGDGAAVSATRSAAAWRR